jgi:hypothetical protein
MHAKFEYLDIYIFVINYFKIWFIVILYNAIMLKREFGQAYGKDILKRIIYKFILYFSEFYFIFYEFWKFMWISRIVKETEKL